MSNHSSEISFPGGHVDPSDESLVDTALRETREEIFTPLEPIFILGMGTAVPSLKGVSVTLVNAILPDEMQQDMLLGDPNEVELVFAYPSLLSLKMKLRDTLDNWGHRRLSFQLLMAISGD